MWRVSQQGVVDGNFGYNSTKAKCGNSLACNWIFLISRYCIECSLTLFNLYMVLKVNRLAQKVSWELLVSKLKTYCHSHVITQSLNIKSLHWHYYDMQLDHNLYKHYLQETRVWKTSHFDKTKYDYIFVFDNYDNITMHDNNVTLQSWDNGMYQIRIYCTCFLYKFHSTSLMTFLEMLHGFIIRALASRLTIVLGDFNIKKLTTSHDSPSSQLLSKFMTNSISNSICIVPQHKNCSLLIIYGQMSLVMNSSQVYSSPE